MSKNHVIMISACSLALLGVLCFFILSQDRAPLIAQKATAEDPATFRWLPDTLQCYRLAMRIETKNSKQLIDDPSLIEIGGILNVKIFEVGDKIKLGLQLYPISVGNGVANDPLMESFYSQPFLAEMDKDGRFAEFHYPPSINREDRPTLSGLALPFESIIKPTKTYDLVQQDTTGTYRAAYQYSDQGFHKQKIAYDKMETGGEDNIMGLQVDIVSSACTFFPAKIGSWLESIRGEDILQFRASEEMDVLQTLYRYSLQLDIETHGKEAFPEWKGLSYHQILRSYQQKTLSRPSLAEQQKTATFQKKYNQDALRIERMVDPIGNRHARQAVQEFRRFLTLFPAETYRLPELLANKMFNDKQNAEILNSLGIIGTPEAQRVLMEIIDDPAQDEMTRFRASISVSSITKPLIKEVRDDLFSRINHLTTSGNGDVDSTLVLALGTISQNIRTEYPDESHEMVTELRQYLPGKTETQTRYLIKALGNSADESVIPDISQYLDNESTQLRAAAARSLRHMPVDKIEAAFKDALSSETDDSVLVAIIQTLSGIPVSETANTVIGNRARNQSNHDTRRAMITILADNLDRFPANREILSEMLLKETSKENAKQIIKALGQQRPNR